MSGILYFIPDNQKTTPALIHRELFPHCYEQGSPYYTNHSKHCDELSGGFLGFKIPIEKLLYTPDKQIWEKFEKNGLIYYIGYWKDDIPKPSDFARDDMIQGEEIELADGQKWVIPIAKLYSGECALPLVMKRKNGIMEYSIKAKYSKLWELANSIYNVFYGAASEGEKTATLTIDNEFDTAAIALGFNYYLGENEISTLGLIDTENIREICLTLIDYKSLKSMIEKKTVETEDT